MSNNPKLDALLDKMANQYYAKDKTGLLTLLSSILEPAIYKLTLERCRYNQARAAKMLGLSRGCFIRRLNLYFGDEYSQRKIND